MGVAQATLENTGKCFGTETRRARFTCRLLAARTEKYWNGVLKGASALPAFSRGGILATPRHASAGRHGNISIPDEGPVRSRSLGLKIRLLAPRYPIMLRVYSPEAPTGSTLPSFNYQYHKFKSAASCDQTHFLLLLLHIKSMI